MTEVSAGEITVEIILESQSYKFTGQELDVSMESSEEEIIGRLAPAIKEATRTEGNEGIDIVDASGHSDFTIRKHLDENNIFVYPKGLAG